MRRHSSTKTWQPYVAPRAHTAALRQDETLESFPDELLRDEDLLDLSADDAVAPEPQWDTDDLPG